MVSFLAGTTRESFDNQATEECLIWLDENLAPVLQDVPKEKLEATLTTFREAFRSFLLPGNSQKLKAILEQLRAPQPKPAGTAPAGNAFPGQTLVQRNQIQRNARVRNHILAIAGGHCEFCMKPAPFRGQDHDPYLEVHHPIRLADGGPDQVDNAVALCPTCHKRIHHGEDRGELLEALYQKVGRLRRPEV